MLQALRERDVWLWGLLWVLHIKLAATGEHSCCRNVFELCL